jgi:8-oxo-dGTP pyrophosphatase MutT (NUDIX family)
VKLAPHVPKRIEENGTILCSVAVVLSPEGEVLLIRRAEHPEDPWSGHIALPGGRVDPGEERLQAALRETFEETSLRLEADWLVAELDDVHPRTQYLPQIVIRPFVFVLPAKAQARPSAEVAECLWTPLSALAESAGTAMVNIRGREVAQAAFSAAGQPVWGLTHRILSQLLELSGRAVPRDTSSRSIP